jgi:hypothetical protein
MTSQAVKTKTVYEASSGQPVWLRRDSANTPVMQPRAMSSKDKDSYCADRATD